MGETGNTEISHDIKEFYSTTLYYPALDKVVSELWSRFESNDQDILCSLAEVVLSFKDVGSKGNDKHFQNVSEHYTLDDSLLQSEQKIFNNFLDSQTDLKVSSASEVANVMYKNDLHLVLPTFWRAATILSAIPATSCSAERSFSGLQQMKTYLSA